MSNLRKKLMIGILAVGTLAGGTVLLNVSPVEAASGTANNQSMMGFRGAMQQRNQQQMFTGNQNFQGGMSGSSMQQQSNQQQMFTGNQNFQGGMSGSSMQQSNQQQMTTGNQSAQGGMNGSTGQQQANQQPAGGNIISQVADILDVEEDTIFDELNDGQTLVEIAADYDITEEDLLSKLEGLQIESIEAAVDAGTITEKQADTLKDNLADSLEKIIERASDQQQMTTGNQNAQGGMNGSSIQQQNNQQPIEEGGQQFAGGNVISQVADILGIEEQDVLDGLKDGQTLAEIAVANDVTEAELLSELEELQIASIDAAVDEGTLTEDEAETLKEDLADNLGTIIENTSNQQSQANQQPIAAGGQQFAGGNVISQVADILGIEEQDILDDLKDGQTLAEIAVANDVTEAELLSELEELQIASIDELVDDGTITEDQAETLKEDLADRLEKIINNDVDVDVTNLSDLKQILTEYFTDAGDNYFDDDGIDLTIRITGDEDNLSYRIKLNFENANEHENVTDLSETEIESFLAAIESKINTEIDGTNYEDASITGKLLDSETASYAVTFDGSSYTFSW